LAHAVSGALWTAVGRGFRRTALPLASYYVITLAVPIANGAAHSGAAFVTHAIPVIVVPPVAIVVACGVHSTVRRLYAGHAGRTRDAGGSEAPETPRRRV
jgi:hypothetical protein